MLPVILTSCMGMEYVGILFNFVHVFKFAFDGEGVELLKVVGNFIDNVAQCLFMLLLLLIVKGWTITRMDLTWKSRVILFTIWTAYTMAILALFIWNLVSRKYADSICFSTFKMLFMIDILNLCTSSLSAMN